MLLCICIHVAMCLLWNAEVRLSIPQQAHMVSWNVKELLHQSPATEGSWNRCGFSKAVLPLISPYCV